MLLLRTAKRRFQTSKPEPCEYLLDDFAYRVQQGPASCIGSGMSVIGKIECDGPAQVFGRIEGELRAGLGTAC
jgi:hypothetical protein